MAKRKRWCPDSWPTPAELGWKVGDRVRWQPETHKYDGVVTHIYKRSFVVEFEGGATIQCHPDNQPFEKLESHS